MIDAQLQYNPSVEATSDRPLWSTLTRWLSPAASAADPVLGYESAQPWTLGEDAPVDAGETRHY